MNSGRAGTPRHKGRTNGTRKHCTEVSLKHKAILTFAFGLLAAGTPPPRGAEEPAALTAASTCTACCWLWSTISAHSGSCPVLPRAWDKNSTGGEQRSDHGEGGEVQVVRRGWWGCGGETRLISSDRLRELRRPDESLEDPVGDICGATQALAPVGGPHKLLQTSSQLSGEGNKRLVTLRQVVGEGRTLPVMLLATAMGESAHMQRRVQSLLRALERNSVLCHAA